MFRLFRMFGFRKRNIINLVGLILMISGAIITIINLPVWFWMSVVGILIMVIGHLLYNQK